MFRILLPSFAALIASTPSPQDTAMRSSSPISAAVEGTGGTPSVATSPGQDTGARGQAAQGPIPEPVSVVGNPAPASAPVSSPNLPAEALGRRILSTAFVRVGPDGQLTVEQSDGRVLVLRDITMGPKTYCGLRMVPHGQDGRYCGRYADVAAARPGGTPEKPGPAMVDPAGPARSLPKGR